jgi:hypothetical protein
MLILSKIVFPHQIAWYVRQIDNTTQNWKDIGITQIEMDKIIAIMTVLRGFPMEIREKIFYQLVTTAFQERFILSQVTQQIQLEYEAKNHRFVNQEVRDFIGFSREVGIRPTGTMIYHLIMLLEETYGPLQAP